MTRSAPQQLLEDLDSSKVSVRRRAASNRKATAQVLLKALRDKDWRVRFKVVRNPKVTPGVLLKALGDEDELVRRVAASHPNATPGVLLKAMEHEDVNVRYDAAWNPNIKKLDIPVKRWLELIAGGCFVGVTKNIPPHVKKDPSYKGIMLLSELAYTPS